MPSTSLPLAATRSRLGPAPRSLSAPGPGVPWWLNAADALSPSYHHFDEFLTGGSLTWGCIVKANTKLWKDGSGHAAAQIVHGLDPAQDPVPSALESVARRLASLRGKQPRDPAWAALAQAVDDDMGRPLRQPVPPSLAAGPPVALSTIVIWPELLPVPRLACSLLPVLLHPHHAPPIVLPRSFWHDDLRRFWLEWEPL